MMTRLHMPALLSAMLIALIMPAQVRATTFILASTGDLLKASDTVILGQVRAIRSVEDGGTFRTHVDVGVAEVAKGSTRSDITIVEPGGFVGGRQRWIHGAPTFFVGERVLLFLHRNAAGEFETTFLSMGKFRVVSTSSGRAFAVRDLSDARIFAAAGGRLAAAPAVTTHRLDVLMRRLRRMTVAAGPSGATSPELLAVPPSGSHFESHFTYTSLPLVRWFLPDQGLSVPFVLSVDPDATLGLGASTSAANEALAAWSSPPCTNLRLLNAGTAPPSSFSGCDGVSEITFNDPFGEIDDPINCSGVLAVGGLCADANVRQSFGGLTAYRIVEGDVMVNSGFGACVFWNETNLAELLTHEIGHSIGLGHSSEDPNESDPSLRDATMYYAAHFDGRGAELMTDDVAALCSLYPAGQTGTVSWRRFAIVSDSNSPTPSDRLVVDGTLQSVTGAFRPQSDTLIVDLRAAEGPVYRLAVPPGQWQTNPAGTRVRYQGVSGTGITTLTISLRGAGAFRLHLHASGLNLSAAHAEPLVISLALGRANVSQTMPQLRSSGRIRVYP